MRDLHKVEAATAKLVWEKAIQYGRQHRCRVTGAIVSRLYRHVLQAGTGKPVSLLSTCQLWYTPVFLLQLVRQVFSGGDIDLDPCSDCIGQSTVQATSFFCAEQDGLQHSWHGRVFVNPPFGMVGAESHQSLFLKKALHEHRTGRTQETVLLLKAAVGYAWFQQVLQLPHAWLSHKVSFGRPDEQHAPANPHGSVVVYLGPNVDNFCLAFGAVACVPGHNSWSCASSQARTVA